MTFPAAHRRAGMTFLEVVAAFALLGVVTAAIFGVFGFVSGTQLRQQRMLGCAEVANRLMLQYLDEPTGMPDTHKPVEYGPQGAPARFRWDYSEDPVQITEVLADQRDQSRQSPFSPDRFRQVTIRVWLSEESGGSRFPEGDTPSATLSRMVDPMAPRNPDSFMNMLQNPEAFRQFMQTMMGFQGNTVRGGTPGGNAQGQNRPDRTQFGAGGLDPRGAFRQGPRGGNRFDLGRFGAGGGGNARPQGPGSVRPGGAPK
jgi:type II secretory pathway pseudopilin PulG